MVDELTFSTSNSIPIPIENLYKGCSCFLVVGGPSLKTFDLKKLDGLISMGVNNSPVIYKPKLWTFVDDPNKFLLSIWKNPYIMKFSPFHKKEKRLFNSARWEDVPLKTKECPNVIFYHRNNHFQPAKWLNEKTVNWGNSKENGGTRSVFLAAIKILYLLGFRKVFLVGCDFRMKENEQNYAWKQDRTSGSIKNNNKTYQVLNERFNILRPLFEEKNFFIFNCTPNSGLKSFPFIDFSDAIEIAKSDFEILGEKTEGLYERTALLKKDKK